MILQSEEFSVPFDQGDIQAFEFDAVRDTLAREFIDRKRPDPSAIHPGGD